MKQRIELGVVCLARHTFDVEAAAGIYRRIRDDLAKLEQAGLHCIPELVIEVEDARAAARRLAAEGVDGLVCISGTFHLGHLILEFEKILRVPILLWGLPELPYNGGKIRLNSVCGVNLNASNLYKAGLRGFHYTIGEGMDEAWLDGLRVRAALRRARVGLAGFRAHGFFNLSVNDLELYRDTGILLDHYELDEIWNFPAGPAELRSRLAELKNVFDVSGISAEQLDKVAGLSAKLNGFLARHKLDALALRCWPEFAGSFGISPCAAMSLLQSEGRILACEGDVEGALSMLAHAAAGAETPFLFDFSQVDLERDFALFWHCGVAPCNLWDGACVRSLDSYFAGGKGVTADFVLKPGPLSILRIDSACGKPRLFLQRAEAVPMEKELKGTYLKAVFQRPVREVLDLVVSNGFAHHASVVYGDYIKPMELFAKMMGWEVVK